MPRGIQNVDPLAIVIKLHHGRGNGDPPLLFDFHPVGLGEVRAAPSLNRSGFPNDAPKEEELFRNCRLPGVGVRNDRKGPALTYCIF